MTMMLVITKSRFIVFNSFHLHILLFRSFQTGEKYEYFRNVEILIG